MIGYNKSEIVGKMRERVILQNRIITQSDSGFQSEIYNDIGIYWSKIEYKTGFEEEDADKITNQQKINITLRYNILVNVNSRFVYRNELYQVEKVEYSDDRRFMTCVCVWRSSYTSIYAGSIFCSASLLAQSSLSAALMRVIKYQSSLNAFGSVSADIALVQKVASSLNAFGTLTGDISFVQNMQAALNGTAALSGDINFVQKVQASLLTSSSVTGNIIIPKLVQASLTGSGTTAANLTVNAPSATLLLDLYPNAAVAYSLRKLRSAYTGSAIRVRASTSGAEGDVSFDVNSTISASSTVTVTAVGTSGISIGQQVTFGTFWNAGGSNQDVFVTTWYDQSGNARDAAQTTQANQPQIVSSGSIINLNSKPTVQFNNQQFITRASFNVSSVSTFTLMNKYNINGYGAYLRNVTSTGNSFGIFTGIHNLWTSQCVNFTNGVDVNPNPTRRSVGKTLPTNQYLENWIYNTNIRKIYENNINLTTSTGLTGWGGKTNFTLGSISYDGNPGIEKVEIQELIIYDLDQTANLSAINTNINTHYAIY